jgi:hypothetical protein
MVEVIFVFFGEVLLFDKLLMLFKAAERSGREGVQLLMLTVI